MKKRIVTLLVAASMLLTACGNDTKNEAKDLLASGQTAEPVQESTKESMEESVEESTEAFDGAEGRENTSGKPNVTETPGSTRKPAATQKPGSTEKPASTQKPENTQKPDSTEKPASTQMPENTRKPDSTEKPASTQMPENTQKPDSTEKPASTQMPENTQKPDSTEKPASTQMPENTQKPDSTEKPEESTQPPAENAGPEQPDSQNPPAENNTQEPSAPAETPAAPTPAPETGCNHNTVLRQINDEDIANCTGRSRMVKICTLCGEITETIEDTGVVEMHSFGAAIWASYPTCTTPGEQYHICSVCGKEDEHYFIAADGVSHNYVKSEESVVEPGNCGNQSILSVTYTCTICGGSETKTELGSVNDSIHYDYNGDGFCNGCGAACGDPAGTSDQQ